jgi:acyl carrier protein
MELRKMYRIQIPEEDYPHLNTLAGTVSYLLPRLQDVPVSA